jgi:hypothetical protein
MTAASLGRALALGLSLVAFGCQQPDATKSSIVVSSSGPLVANGLSVADLPPENWTS